jgi:hypothetical protein
MTEEEWLVSDYVQGMLFHLTPWLTDRKLRLLRCAPLRGLWERLGRDVERRAIEISERYADGLATGSELDEAVAQIFAWEDYIHAQDFEAVALAAHVAEAVRRSYRGPFSKGVAPDLIREVFGSPLHRVAADPAWQTTNIITLARSIYDDRSFDALPLLADLLEEAGAPAELSAHCRSPGPHVRGCRALDLILGKS